jgi:uncharacterized protein with NRDE domain
MCLLAILHRVCHDAPLVIGANREEFYARGGDPPRRLDDLDAVAGVDPTHGGTWLGVNARGVLIAVTNRPKSIVPATPRSRGLLARELLRYNSAVEAASAAARDLDGGPYAGCNFFCADQEAATVIQAGDWLRVRPLPPGIHVLSNRDLNDPTDYRVGFASEWLAGRDLSSAQLAVAALMRLCRQREPAGAPMCFRHERRGSVSSSILALRPELQESLYLHAQGPPDATHYADVSSLFRDLAGAGRKE